MLATLSAPRPPRNAVERGVNGAPRLSILIKGIDSTAPPSVISATHGQSVSAPTPIDPIVTRSRRIPIAKRNTHTAPLAINRGRDETGEPGMTELNAAYTASVPVTSAAVCWPRNSADIVGVSALITVQTNGVIAAR